VHTSYEADERLLESGVEGESDMESEEGEDVEVRTGRDAQEECQTRVGRGSTNCGKAKGTRR